MASPRRSERLISSRGHGCFTISPPQLPATATRFPSHGSGRPGLVLRTATKLSSVGFEPTAVLTFVCLPICSKIQTMNCTIHPFNANLFRYFTQNCHSMQTFFQSYTATVSFRHLNNFIQTFEQFHSNVCTNSFKHLDKFIQTFELIHSNL